MTWKGNHQTKGYRMAGIIDSWKDKTISLYAKVIPLQTLEWTA